MRRKLILLFVLGACTARAQDSTKNGWADIYMSTFFYREEMPRQGIGVNLRIPKTIIFSSLSEGIDPPNLKKTTALHIGLFLGGDKLHVIPTTGFLWSFDGGYNGWSVCQLTIGGAYPMYKKISLSYMTRGQYVVTTDYNFSHIIILANEADFVSNVTEIGFNFGTWLRAGYCMQIFHEVSPKEKNVSGLRVDEVLQSDNPRGIFAEGQYKHGYLKLCRTWHSLQTFSVTLGYRY